MVKLSNSKAAGFAILAATFWIGNFQIDKTGGEWLAQDSD